MKEVYEFQIPCTWECCGYYHVEAYSLEGAIKKAEDTGDLPEQSEYIDGSFEINYDVVEEANRILLEIMKIKQTPKEKLPLLMGQIESEEAKTILNERLKEL